jgi:hypothetical protein
MLRVMRRLKKSSRSNRHLSRLILPEFELPRSELSKLHIDYRLIIHAHGIEVRDKRAQQLK